MTHVPQYYPNITKEVETKRLIAYSKYINVSYMNKPSRNKK